jgi:YfiH family protein
MRIPNWYRNGDGALRYYRAWHLHASGLVKHGFSTRIGGLSPAPYDTLNLGTTVGDSLELVVRNRQVYAEALGIDHKALVVPNQTHGANVVLVTAEDAGRGAVDHATAVPDTDALITDTPRLPLALHFADCAGVFLLDPEHKAIGMVHAGWKGTALKITAKAVEAMMKEFSTRPSKMLAAIGPAIGRCCCELGELEAREMFNAFPYDERILKQSSVAKWRVDIKTANLILLIEAGDLYPISWRLC